MLNRTIAISSIFPLIMLLSGFAFFVVTDKYYISRIHKRVMLIALILVIAKISNDVFDYYLINIAPDRMMRTLNCSFGYIVLPVILVMFYYFLGERRSYIPAWCMIGVNTAVYVFTVFVPIAFEINAENYFVRHIPLGYTAHVITFLLMINLLFLVIHDYRQRKTNIFIPVFCVLMLVGAMLLDTASGQKESAMISYVSKAAAISIVLFYTWIHRYLVFDYEDDMRAEQRIRIMVSQIQPHFLYNTIATFKALCRRDPEKAAVLAGNFGQYLRQNLDAMNNSDLIPVESELDHTRIYTDIEKVRFENIQVEYDIRDTDFSLPALTIQPIVENAIRHGVRIRDEGIVRVCTRTSEGCHEITVCDNGMGFDVSKPYSGDGTHIGISNVRERIEKLCGGTLILESEPGKGTTVTMRIPL